MRHAIYLAMDVYRNHQMEKEINANPLEITPPKERDRKEGKGKPGPKGDKPKSGGDSKKSAPKASTEAKKEAPKKDEKPVEKKEEPKAEKPEEKPTESPAENDAKESKD
jgi:hypothetical protein